MRELTASEPVTGGSWSARRLIGAAAWWLLAAWITADAVATNVFSKRPWPGGVVDYFILYHASRQVLATHLYPPHYPYPPASVVLQAATAFAPYPVAAALYLAMTVAAAILCWRILTEMLFQHDRTAGALCALAAYASSNYFFQWDLRSLNCNILCLAAFLAGLHRLRHSPKSAGALLALSVAIKPFSILACPYLFWKGERRAAAWMVIVSLILWIVLPCLVFSPAGAWRLYQAWLDQIRPLSRPDWADPSHPILISLNLCVLCLSRSRPGLAAAVVPTARLLWGALVAAGIVVSWRRGRSGSARSESIGLLADLSLLLLAPIALSSYLEPYHPVLFAAAAMLLLRAGADANLSGRDRTVAWSTLLLSTVTLMVHAPFALRGMLVNVKLLIALAGVVWTEWARIQARRPVWSTSATESAVSGGSSRVVGRDTGREH